MAETFSADGISQMKARINHIKLTGDGHLQIVLKTEPLQGVDLDQVRDLIPIISGAVHIDIKPIQQQLPLE